MINLFQFIVLNFSIHLIFNVILVAGVQHSG